MKRFTTLTSLARSATMLFLLMALITGGAYPLIVTLLSQAIFPQASNGSLLTYRDRIAGSALIGQSFTRPEYFSGRPSATVQAPYNALASGGSNLSNENPQLMARIDADVKRLLRENAGEKKIPVGLVTASGSGLDPHILPQDARYQLARVASARGLSQMQVNALIERYTQTPAVPFGNPVVNVLELNMALDNMTLGQR
ncbi:potassium-transporting ATPase subunit KdpC [Leminorella grimontii]|uniref:potassium-transporting ATPase subunit KdpC n=1 Tax=Leminorella grimontii TaxID=82981 RepID=UPI00321F7869